VAPAGQERGFSSGCSIAGGALRHSSPILSVARLRLGSVIGKPSACSDLSMIGVAVWLILQTDQNGLFGAQGASPAPGESGRGEHLHHLRVGADWKLHPGRQRNLFLLVGRLCAPLHRQGDQPARLQYAMHFLRIRYRVRPGVECFNSMVDLRVKCLLGRNVHCLAQLDH